MIANDRERLLRRAACYDLVAAEYYDPRRHPTCSNLRELSELYILPRIQDAILPVGYLVEVGAGRSMLAPAIPESELRRTKLLDASGAMLAYSEEWAALGVTLDIAPAERTGLPDRCASLIISSLGDPYNTPDFWREVMRILAPDGICLFTMPSPDWAKAFRPSKDRSVAEFMTVSSRVVNVPSFVPEMDEQYAMIEAAGLVVIDSGAFGIEQVRGVVSPKLKLEPRRPILSGFSVSLKRQCSPQSY